MGSSTESDDGAWTPTAFEAETLEHLLVAVRAAQYKDVKEHIASLLSCFECGEGADVPRLLNVQDELGWTSLHFACHGGTVQHTQIVILLCRCEADVNIQDKRGWTPLHVAAQFAQPGVLTELLDALADTSILDDHGHVPYDCASTPEKREVLERPQVHLEQLVHEAYEALRIKRLFVQLPAERLVKAQVLEYTLEQHLAAVREELKRLQRRLEDMRTAAPSERSSRWRHHHHNAGIQCVTHEHDEAEMMHSVAERALWRLKSYNAEDLLVSSVVQAQQMLEWCKDGREHGHKLLRAGAEALENAIAQGARSCYETGEYGEEHWADPHMLAEVEDLKDQINRLRFACLTADEASELEEDLRQRIATFGADEELLQGTQGGRFRFAWLRRPVEKMRGCVSKSRACVGCQSIWSRFGF